MADDVVRASGTLTRALMRVVGGPAHLAARWRRARAVHAAGLSMVGELVAEGESAVPALTAALFGGADRVPVRARLSKGLGTPGARADVLGLAVRVPDRAGPDQPLDLLFSSTGRAPGLWWLPLPSGDWLGSPYSTVLPYRAAGTLLWLAALPAPGRRVPASMADLRAAAPLEFVIVTARPTGSRRPVARLTLSGPDEVDVPWFDPMLHCHPLMRPVPAWLAAVREHAYERSRAGRGLRLPPGGREGAR